MYCENCGKELKQGEICSCQKRTGRKEEKKKGICTVNVHMLISLFLFLFGVELFLYFHISVEDIQEMISPAGIKVHSCYFYSGICSLILTGGIAESILAVNNKTMKKASILILVLNLLSLLTVCGEWGINIYQNNKADHYEEDEKNEYVAQITGNTSENSQETTEFVQSVLKCADEFVQTGSIDKARNILSNAYAITNSEEIKNKLNEIGVQKNSSEETHSADTEGESENQADGSGIHRYETFLSDGTWEDAYRGCKERGGHLVTFESQDEFLYVCSLLSENGQEDALFFIGGRRDLDSQNYYWADENNDLTGSILNAPDAWNSGYWMSNEPSFRDSALGSDEHVLSIAYNTAANKWLWSDEPDNLVGLKPSYSGKTGYICEYEN